MAPITTGIELVFSPIEATKIEQINIQAVAPLNWISDLIALVVEAWSVSFLKSSNSLRYSLELWISKLRLFLFPLFKFVLSLLNPMNF